MKYKNKNNLRKNNIILKKNINIVQKRTIVNWGITSNIALTGDIYAVASILRIVFIPVSITVTLLMGFPMDSPYNAANVASQVVDNAEAMPGLTATAWAAPAVFTGLYAVGDAINSDNQMNSDDGENENHSNSESEQSQQSEATLAERERLIFELRDSLHHVNRDRRLNMSLLRNRRRILSHRANVIDSLTHVVREHFSDSLEEYQGIIRDLREISKNTSSSPSAPSYNPILDQAEALGTDPAIVFEDIQDRLDLLAGRLEGLIREWDPNAEFSSDTDSEKIREAVQEHALHYPTRDTTNSTYP